MDDDSIQVLLIADEDPRLAKIKDALRDAVGVELAAESESIDEAASIAPTIELHVIVAHVTETDGPERIQALRSAFPGLHVIAVSTASDPIFAERVLRAGALGYLSNSTAPNEIGEAVRSVARKKAYVNRRVARKILKHLMQSSEDPHSKLTSREREVFDLLSTQAVDQIADGLGLSSRTVRGYCRSIRAKLNLESIAALVNYARDWQSERAQADPHAGV